MSKRHSFGLMQRLRSVAATSNPCVGEAAELIEKLEKASAARTSKVVRCDGEQRCEIIVRFKSLADAHRFDEALTPLLSKRV